MYVFQSCHSNADGSTNFTQEQIDDSAGGVVITVAEAKQKSEQLAEDLEKSSSNCSAFAVADLAPSHSMRVNAGQQFGETVFGGGWQHSRYYYHPATGTGAYLLWRTYIDSGIVGGTNLYPRRTYIDSGIVGGTNLYPNIPKYVCSDNNRGTYIWGVAYKTHNAPYGTRFTVSNW